MNISTCTNQTLNIFIERDSSINDRSQIPWYKKMIKEVRKYLRGNISYGDRIADMLESLEYARSEYSEPNWDGEGALSIKRKSYINAMRFLLSLPQEVRIPEISVDPDGEVNMEWYASRYRIFSVSIGNNGEITYAGRCGASENWGVEYFSDKIPESILTSIARLEMDGNIDIT